MISFATGARSLCIVLMRHPGGRRRDVAAQNAQSPCPPPGTIYTFTDSSSIQALPGAPAPFCRFANVNGGQQVDLFLGAFSAASPIVQANIDVLTSLAAAAGRQGGAPYPGRSGRQRLAGQRRRGKIRDRRGAGRPARTASSCSGPNPAGRGGGSAGGGTARRWNTSPSTARSSRSSAPSGRILHFSPTSWELAGVRVP